MRISSIRASAAEHRLMPSSKSLLKSAVSIHRALPANLADEDVDDYSSETPYETYDTFLRGVGRAFVSADSVIFRKGIVDAGSLYSPEQRTYFQTRYLAKKVLLARKVTLNASQKYLLATDQESSGHFHWLTEVLPRLWLVRDRSSEFVLMLPDTPYVRSIGIESLDLLGLRFADIIWMQADQLLRVPDLFHITKLSRTGRMHDEVMQEIRKGFIGDAGGRGRKVYVSRENAERRKILNETELVPVLRRRGFEIFTAEGSTLKDQVELFSSCGTLLGIHGAGLANCLFMRPGTVVELKKKEPNHGYWQLAGSLGHSYYYYNGVPDSDQSLIGRGCNLTVDVGDLEERILRNI